jgi:hypothetical protein
MRLRFPPDIQNDLLGEPAKPAIDCQSVLRHAKRHVPVISALQFEVNEVPIGRFSDQVCPQTANLRQFHIMPAFDRETSEEFQHTSAEPSDDALEGNIVLMHRTGRVRRRREILTLPDGFT